MCCTVSERRACPVSLGGLGLCGTGHLQALPVYGMLCIQSMCVSVLCRAAPEVWLPTQQQPPLTRWCCIAPLSLRSLTRLHHTPRAAAGRWQSGAAAEAFQLALVASNPCFYFTSHPPCIMQLQRSFLLDVCWANGCLSWPG